MNDEAAKKIVSLLMAAAQAEARKTLPGWVQDNWLSALSDICLLYTSDAADE